MSDDSQVIFITHPYFAVNNPTNNLKLYKKEKNSNNWTITKCKDKNEYRKKLQEYVLGFYGYSRNEKKAHNTIKDYIKETDSSMLDYFMGSKKAEEVMKQNQMKREEMAMLKNGNFILDEDVSKLKKDWCRYIEDSNIQLTVLSFNQSYVDENISVKELQKEITMNLMPKFLSYCGYYDPRNNLEWIVSLHSDRENNYHFHISWVEKNKCFRSSDNKLKNRIKLKLSDNELNFMKRQASLTIERKKLYTPALIKLEKEYDELKKYFNPKDQNFTLYNIQSLELEEKIIKLGYLLNQVRNTDKKYVKYKSLPKNEIGNEIRKITKEIRKELMKDKRIIKSKNNIKKSIENINNILLDIDKRNNISNIGFENAIDNVMIKAKEEKSETYILNAIINHALYNYERQRKRIKKNNFTLEDIITQVAYDNYIEESSNQKIKSVKILKIKLLNNFLKGKRYKNKFLNALDRLGYEQNKAAEQFYEMFEQSERQF